MLGYDAHTGSGAVVERSRSWTFDPGHTQASFSARRMGATWVDGRFTDVHGKFYLDLDDPSSSSCVGEIDVAKLYAGEPFLNTQLRAADFLRLEDHRKITFAARFAPGPTHTELTAEVLLTLHGTTRLVIMDVTYLGEWRAPFWRDGENWGTATRMGVRAEGHITSSDFAGLIQENHANGDGEGVPANAIEIALDIEAALDADLQEIGALEI